MANPADWRTLDTEHEQLLLEQVGPPFPLGFRYEQTILPVDCGGGVHIGINPEGDQVA